MGLRRNLWVTFGVALLFVVQAFFMGLASGAMAATMGSSHPVHDHSLCAESGGGDHDASDPMPAHPHGPDCCTAGCPMLAGGLLPVLVLSIWISVQAGETLVFARPPDVQIPAFPEHSPKRARAPPAQG
ncbi:DUF2946 family protein [Beijerinckia mobilis]|uniref:DUF2946 family protein n=1 Tax=Beijerinckia mobilis TaxID=231434 RepID=UPI00068B7A9A|nr:DUF2946 family protein [Beijerinckia mobilis]